MVIDDVKDLKKFIVYPGTNPDDLVGEYFKKNIIKVCPYKIEVTKNDDCFSFNDIEEFVNGKWSSYISSLTTPCGPYFFELESDAMAFKLRWF